MLELANFLRAVPRRRHGSRASWRRIWTALIALTLAHVSFGCDEDQDRWVRVVASPERFVAFAQTPLATLDVAVSHDGASWTRTELPSATHLVEAVDTGERIVALVRDSNRSDLVLTSEDGTQWETTPAPTTFVSQDLESDEFDPVGGGSGVADIAVRGARVVIARGPRLLWSEGLDGFVDAAFVE